MDLYENFSFYNNDENFYSSQDNLIYNLNLTFTSSVMENYFRNIFDKITSVLNTLNLKEEKNEKLLIQKFYFFYYILYKMNNVFILLLKSDFSYLISDSLIYTNESIFRRFF